MNKVNTHKILTIIIAMVWLVNGLVCKILNLVPRHEDIVARILSTHYSRTIIIIIGSLEILMAIWILSGYKYKLNAIFQIAIVVAMNILEFIIAPDLLLWGKLNIVFALLFTYLVYYKNFKHTKHYVSIS